jgi:hypothetical protein
MSTKITSARIEELESLQKRKENLQEKIQEKKDKMTEIRNAMEDGDTADIMGSSSTAALEKRGKKTSTLTNDDLLAALDIVIDRLVNETLKVDEELQNLKDLVGSA